MLSSPFRHDLGDAPHAILRLLRSDIK